jgi:hypothetical protein
MKSRIVFDPSTGMVIVAQSQGVIQRAPPKPQGYWDWKYNDDSNDLTFYASIFQNGLFITVSSNGIRYSTDGGKWTNQAHAPSTPTLHAITSGKRSTDGEEIFVAVGEEAGFYSSDGKTWTAATGLGDAYLYDVIYANNVFVAVGYDATILYSADGQSWHPALRITGEAQFNAVTYANNVFVAVANSSTIWWSPDGKNWSIATRLSGSANFADVVYGGGKFVAVADYGTIWNSSDGKTWSISKTIPPDGPDIVFYKVSYGNGIFVAAGDMSGAVAPATPIYYSEDGVTWTQAKGIKWDDDYNNWPPFNDLNYVNGYFVAINSEYLVLPMYSSTDGINWNENAPSAPPRGNGGDGPIDPGGGC